jgi:hypothetical protein
MDSTAEPMKRMVAEEASSIQRRQDFYTLWTVWSESSKKALEEGKTQEEAQCIAKKEVESMEDFDDTVKTSVIEYMTSKSK